MLHNQATLLEEGAALGTPFPAYLKKETERGKEIKTEAGTELEIETERGKETEEERETGIKTESKIVPVVVEEMKEIKILALERRGKEREDNIQAAENAIFQRGPKEAEKRGKAIETGSLRGIGDGMVVLLSRHLSKILMGLTSLLSSEPLQSPPPQPLPPYLAPRDLPQPLPVGPCRNLTNPTRERRRENGIQLERWRIEEVDTADHSHSHHQGITAMSQTTIQIN